MNRRPWFLGMLLALSLLGACRTAPTTPPTSTVPLPTATTAPPPTLSPTPEAPQAPPTVAPEPTTLTDFVLQSPAFNEGDPIPVRYTCDGENLSPPLTWQGTPPKTQALVLIMDDPDAPGGTWVHWVLYDIPPEVTQLAEGAQGVGVAGINSWHESGYGGPCPPPGKPHRYVFHLYALDAPLGLAPGATRQEVEQALQDHLLAEATLFGLFGH